MDEIEHCIQALGIREFNFNDELFTIKSERTMAICEEILRRNLGIAWVCMPRAAM